MNLSIISGAQVESFFFFAILGSVTWLVPDSTSRVSRSSLIFIIMIIIHAMWHILVPHIADRVTDNYVKFYQKSIFYIIRQKNLSVMSMGSCLLVMFIDFLHVPYSDNYPQCELS